MHAWGYGVSVADVSEIKELSRANAMPARAIHVSI